MPKPGQKGYKGPVHEAVRSALGPLAPKASAPAAPATSRPSQLAANQADYAAAKASLRAAKAKARAPRGLMGESYDVLSGARMSPKPKTMTATVKPKARK